jgi:nucleoside-diphosphate-sugar epimerase
MSKVLITGATGFIGRHCLPILMAKGYDVHAINRRKPATTLPGAIWHEVDLLVPGAPSELIHRVRPDFLLHLGWYAVPGKFWEARENLEWVRASLELFSAFSANNGQRAVAAGSCAEYETNCGECVEGITPLLPATLYGTCKHAFGSTLASFSRQTGFSSAWGRIFFLYGPYEQPSRLVAYVVQSLLRAEPALCSEGNQVLDFMHVEDAASAFVALLESRVQGSVNIASGRPVAVRDLLQEIGTQLGRGELIRLGALGSSSGASRIWASTEKLTREVGWKPHYNFASGIQQTIEWWRNSAAFRAEDSTREANKYF